MASALPTITSPSASITPSQAYLNEISESLSQARQALDRIVRELESLDGLESTIDGPEEHEINPHTVFGAQATSKEGVRKELAVLEGWLEAMESLIQHLLEDSTNLTSTTRTTTAVVDERRKQDWALYGSKARYTAVVLLLSASLLATLFALFFVSTRK